MLTLYTDTGTIFPVSRSEGVTRVNQGTRSLMNLVMRMMPKSRLRKKRASNLVGVTSTPLETVKWPLTSEGMELGAYQEEPRRGLTSLMWNGTLYCSPVSRPRRAIASVKATIARGIRLGLKNYIVWIR